MKMCEWFASYWRYSGGALKLVKLFSLSELG